MSSSEAVVDRRIDHGTGDLPSLGRLMRIALGGWPLILLATLLAGLLAISVLRWIPPEYTASMVVGPTARTGSAAAGPRIPIQPGYSTASLTEFGNGDEALSDFSRFLELLGAELTAASLLERSDPLGAPAKLFPERWNPESASWQPPGGLIGRVRTALLHAIGRSDWLEPDAELVARQLRRHLVIQPVGIGPMRRLVFRHPDRAFAVTVLARLAAAADGRLRAEAQRRSAAQVSFVRQRLATTTVAEHRRALADLLAQLEQTAILSEVDLPFAADPIEPPSAPMVPDWPNPMIILPLSLGAGVALGLLLAFALASGGERRPPRPRRQGLAARRRWLWRADLAEAGGE